MKAVTVKLSDTCNARVRRLARERRTSTSNVIREALERGLAADDALADIRDLVGMAEGPADLSSNPEHLEGYGR